jgi:hypothetical protein
LGPSITTAPAAAGRNTGCQAEVAKFCPGVRKGVVGGLSNTIWGTVYFGLPFFNCIDPSLRNGASDLLAKESTTLLDLNLQYFGVPYCEGSLARGSRGESIVFDDVRRTESGESILDIGPRRTHECLRCRHTRVGHHLLRERFAAFDLGRGSGGSKAVDATSAYGISRPGHERHLGPDHNKIDSEFSSECRNSGRILNIDQARVHLSSNTRVARSCDNRGHLAVAQERPHQRMLASTRADDEDLHGYDPSEYREPSTTWVQRP